MPNNDYWDDPVVKAAEAAYKKAKKQSRFDKKYDQARIDAENNLLAARKEWLEKHPSERNNPPWKHAFDEDQGGKNKVRPPKL